MKSSDAQHAQTDTCDINQIVKQTDTVRALIALIYHHILTTSIKRNVPLSAENFEVANCLT